MGKSSKAPEAPDPNETAAAQGKWSAYTALAQQSMNMIGQNTPWGTLDYSQNGTTKVRDPEGNIIEVPNYTANVKLTPQQQAIFNQSQAAQTNLATIANNQSKQVQDALSKPFEFDNQDAANWAYDLGSQRLDPRFQQQSDALRTQLINQGIRPGTEAYDREMTRLGQEKNDAYNQLMLTGRGQAFSESLATRNQPLNELNALLSQSQVQNPTSGFAQTPQTQLGGVDYAGIVNNNYAQQMAGWQANQQSKSNMLGGLFGLGRSVIGLWG